MITHNDQYIAKESLTVPLLVVIMFGVFLYASICASKFLSIFGAVFFGLIVAVYAYKYIRHGRTTLIIDSEAITVKDWGKTQIFYWIYIVSVYTELRITYVGLWDQQWLSIKTSVNGEQYEFQDICLSDLYCRSKSVRKAIEKYAGRSHFDYEASRKSRHYAAKMQLAALVAAIVIFICVTFFSE